MEVHELGTAPRTRVPCLGFPEDLAHEVLTWLEAQGMTTIARGLRPMVCEIPPSPSQLRETIPRLGETPQRRSTPEARILRSIARAATAQDVAVDDQDLSDTFPSLPEES